MKKKFSRGSSFWDIGDEKVISVTPADEGRSILVCACSADGDHHVVTIQLSPEQALQFSQAIAAAAGHAEENEE